jgi:imidazolonepropionase-like amidohydrolase
MGTANLVRTALNQAQTYAARKAAGKDVAPDMKSEALALVLAGKLPMIFSAHRADDLMTGLRLAEEFRLQPMLTLATESYLILDKLEAAKVPIILHPTMQRPSTPESFHSHVGTAGLLAERKLPFTICSAFEGYVPKTRVLRWEAAMAAVNGLGYDRALKCVTLDAARLLGIDKDFGSVEVGKSADLVLYDGDPFEHSTHVTATVLAGRVVYDREEYLQMPFERRAMQLSTSGGDYGCCLGAW